MKKYYKQSQQIRKLINRAQRVLINLHKNPDYDAFASALGLARVLKPLGKSVTITSSHQFTPPPKLFVEVEKIKVISYVLFDFSRFDLLIIVDSARYDRVTGDKSIPLPKIPYFVIDHHATNAFPTAKKLVDPQASSTSEIIYKLIKDWQLKIDKVTATMLLAGIVGDTICFRSVIRPQEVLQVASELIKSGADYQQIILQLYNNFDFSFVKLVGRFIDGMRQETTKKGTKFVWSAVSYADYVKFGRPEGVREAVADNFFRSIRGVDFGLAILETKPQQIFLSFRSKPGFDVSSLAQMFGGGGHKQAAGANIKGPGLNLSKECVPNRSNQPFQEFSKTVKNIINQLLSSA